MQSSAEMHARMQVAREEKSSGMRRRGTRRSPNCARASHVCRGKERKGADVTARRQTQRRSQTVRGATRCCENGVTQVADWGECV
eukprot:4144504-Pleurochrysis_carterae.AAC.2